ncbi:hypothetical protein [[Kitasatospora] papulosa]|uniref:hypothetical protein n=1 Tax=[Kitasatospora] papulosa TaxID=1464011 RepID=UPI0036ABCBEE
MPTLDQAWDELRACLTGTPPQQVVDLVEAAHARPPLSALTDALLLLGPPASLRVDEVTLTRERGRGLLTGLASVGLGGAGSPETDVGVVVTLTEPDAGSVLFTLALTVRASGWTLGSTFTLPYTLRATPSTPALAREPSVLGDLAFDGATFTASSAPGARLTFHGALRPSGVLERYSSWVGPWPLDTEGEITLPASSRNAPVLDLRARTSGWIGIEHITVRRLGFELVCAPEGAEEADDIDPSMASELRLIGTVEIGGERPLRAELSAVLLVSDTVLRLTADFGGEGPSLAGGLGQLASLFGLDAGDLRTPPALGGFETFCLDEVEVWLKLDDAGFPDGLHALAATIRSDKVWEPPLPFLKISNVGTRWAWTRITVDENVQDAIAGSVFGSLLLGPGENPGIIDLSALLPSFVVTGQQREGTSIDLGAAFGQLFGRSGPPLDGSPKITDLALRADPFRQEFEAGAALQVELVILNDIVLTELSFAVEATPSSLSGGLEGRVRLGPEGAPELSVRAELPASDEGGWKFSGGLVPGVPLTLEALLSAVGITVGEAGSCLWVSRLEGTVDTHGRWSFAGAVGVAFHLTVFGAQVAVEAGAEVELAGPGPAGPATGQVAAQFTVNRLRVRARGEIGVAQPVYGLRVEFGGIWLQASTAWRTSETEGAKCHQVMQLQLGGVTLGELIEEIVNLAAPGLGFQLDAPWDVLKRLELSRFTLTVDPTERIVEMTYDIGQDIGVLNLDTVGVRYSLSGSTGVDLILSGEFLGRPFRGDDALTWDVVNEAPPAVPGKGPRLLDLRYLGVGQRVCLPEPQPETVAEAIAALRRAMPAPSPEGGDPLAGGGMTFDASGGWLIGADLSVMETIEVALVFHDPGLYGLSVALEGDRAGPLSGLRCEILYKRLASGIGMFRTELRTPEKFRRIELGPVSVGLGLITVEVYTNGNFLVDLGFPHDRDFTRSFDVQAFPFLGRGGIYLGVLNGQTSRRVPALADGTFSPVLELGIGLAVGVGKDISAGPLSGGAYLEVEVIFEGVLAWFHPETDNHAVVTYHRAQGLVAVHGKVYATADFGVVKAAVTLEAYAQASVVFESCRATWFRLNVHARAEAEIEILFVTVSFSCEVELDLSFSVGQDQPTPWTIAEAEPQRSKARGEPRRLTTVQQRRALMPALAGSSADGDARWVWDPRHRVFPSPRTVPLWVLPAFSVQHPPVFWSSREDAPQRAAELPDWQVALPFFVANGVEAQARTASAAVAPEHEPASPQPAAVVVEALFRWALSGLPTGADDAAGPTVVTAGQLDLLARELTEDYVAQEQFAADRLAEFFATNLPLRISGDDPAQAASSAGSGAMAFPAPPWLSLACDPGTVRDLFTTNPVGPVYAAGTRSYLARFAPVAATAEAPTGDDPARYPSFAAQVFSDWCLLVTREAVRLARASLDEATVVMSGTEHEITLDTTARRRPTHVLHHRVRPGETVPSVAQALGVGVAELDFWNHDLATTLASVPPGYDIEITVGIAGTTLAVENADRPLAPGVTVHVPDVRTQVRADETLDSLSERLYGSPQPLHLVAEAELAQDRRLLRPGATLPMSPRPNPLIGRPDVDLAAAVMYVRCFAPAGVPRADWYTQSVVSANERVLADLPPEASLPLGLVLAVPDIYAGPATGSYTVQTGDTLPRIGATLALAQSPGAYPAPSWATFLAGVRESGGATIPRVSPVVQPDESLTMLADRLVVVGGAESLAALVADQRVLRPLAVLRLTLPLSSTAHTTLADMARTAGLSVDEIARRPQITGAHGLFPPGTPLTVQLLPAQTTDELVRTVCGGSGLTTISAQASRTLLSGTRLPAPEADERGITRATGPLTGMFVLTGQQSGLPVTAESGLAVTVRRSPRAPAQEWITFADTDGTTVETLTFGYDGAELAERCPASGLTRLPVSGPKALPAAGTVPRTYGLEKRLMLQVACGLRIPGADTPQAGAPTLWPFPSALLTKAAAGVTTPYDVYASRTEGELLPEHALLGDATFGTLVCLPIRRIPGHRQAYELLAVEPGDARLLHLLATAPPSESATQLLLAMAPAPGAGGWPDGLTVFDTDPGQTFVVRTDMTTAQPHGRPPETVSADLAEGGPFVELLRQACLTGSGHYLGFSTRAGDDLLAGGFGDDGVGRLWLIAVRPEAQRPAPTGRVLRPADTCVLLPPGSDAGAHTLYVEAHGIHDEPHRHPDELTTQALLPPGSAGVTLTVPRALSPDPGDAAPERAAARIAQLFSLLVTEVSGPAFSSQGAGPPAPPQREDGEHAPEWIVQRRRRALCQAPQTASARSGTAPPVEYWRYDQVMPLHRYADATAAPSPMPFVTGLPSPEDDPYRGFGASGALASATFLLGFADVLGNVTGESYRQSVTVPTGYTDPLLGPGAWPATTTSFGVTRGQAGAELIVALTAQPSNAAPGPLDDPASTASATARQADRYAQVLFQLAQPTAHVSVRTTLAPGSDGEPSDLPVAEGITPLWRFAAAAHLTTSAARTLRQPAVSTLATLGDVTAEYGIPLSSLGTANADRPFSDLFAPGQPVTVSARITVVEKDTATTILRRVPAGWPVPATAADLLRDPANAALPLRPGTVLATTSRSLALGSQALAVTLVQVAADHRTTPGQLAIDSGNAAVLAPGFSFRAGGVTVTVNEALSSFAAVQQEFRNQSVDVSLTELGTAAADRTGLFAAFATLTSDHVVSAEGDSLASIAGSDLFTVAAGAADQPNLWASGRSVTLGVFPAAVVPTGPEETLRSFAESHGATAANVVAGNPHLRLSSSPRPVLPGTVALPATLPPALRVPYTVVDGDTLAALAALFATAPVTIAGDNAGMPGVLAADRGVSVTVDGRTATTTTRTDDTLTAVTTRLAAQVPAVDLPSVAAAIAATPLLAPGALLSMPPPPLASRTSAGRADLTAREVRASYGVPALAFAQLNAATCGLLASGVVLRAPDGTQEATAPSDTLNGVLGRFADRDARCDLAALLEANADVALFRGGALALLPPATATVSTPLHTAAGPFPRPVFPLSVVLRLTRDEAVTLVHDESVLRADTVVPALTVPSGTENAPQTHASFAAAFHTALPHLRLGTAGVAGQEADLWVADVREQGLGSISVAPGVQMRQDAPAQPRFLALRPLHSAPQSRKEVPAPVLDESGALTDSEKTLDFQGIDIEVWARQFLADLDLYLSAPYVVGMRANLASREALDRLLKAKWTLTGAVAQGLAPLVVPAVPDTRAVAGRASAVRDLRRACGASLSAAYDMATVVQYDARVSSAYTDTSRGLLPARLSGSARSAGGPATPEAEFTLTTAATQLAHEESFVNFVLTTPDPEHHATVPTRHLTYVYDAVEFDIGPAADDDTGGHETSHWFHFLEPLGADGRVPGIVADLGAPDVPVALRMAPSTPALTAQTATPSVPDPAPLSQAARWTFGLTYEHEHTAQDEILLAVAFNVREKSGGLRAELDLVDALARYTAVSDELRSLMSVYLDPADPRHEIRDEAAGTAAELAQEVAAAWDGHWTTNTDDLAAGQQAQPADGDTFHFRVRTAYAPGEAGAHVLTELTLVLDTDTAAPGPDGQWPTVTVRGTGGAFIKLDGAVRSAASHVYTPPAPLSVTGSDLLAIRIEWPGLNLATVSNGRASLASRRNAGLINDAQTNGSFVLASVSVTAPEAATPFLERRSPVTLVGPTLEDALTAAFTELFDDVTGPPVTVALTYSHQLVAPEPDFPGSGLSSCLPVALCPSTELTPAVAAQLQAAATAWTARHRPATEGGAWHVSLTLSSWLDPQTARPLLVIDRLTLPLTWSG